MKKTTSIALLSLSALLATTADSAVLTANVTGSLDTFQWKWGLSQYDWNNFFASSQAEYNGALAVGNTGYTTQRGTVNGFNIALSGSITYDNVTNQVIALTLNQQGTLSGLRPLSNLAFAPGAGTPLQLYSTDPEVAYSGASWTLGSNALGQTLELNGLDNNYNTGVKAVSCVSHFNTTNGPCDDPQGFYRPFLGHLVGNGIGSGDPLNSGETGADTLAEESLWDFDGIPAGFNPGGAAPFVATPGATFTINGTTVDIALFSQSGLLVAGGNSAGRGHVQLSIVPAPAAVWLLGTAVGALGLRKRLARKSI